MQDPEIAIACAALGLLERRRKEDEELCAFLQEDTNFEGDRQYDTALIYLKRYLPTLPQADIRGALVAPRPSAHSRSLLWLATAVSLLDIAHAIAQAADVQADTVRGRSPCHCTASMPWRLACEPAASPLLPLPPGHLDLADAALRLPAADSQKPLPHKTTLALYGAGLRLVPSFV